MSDFSTARRNMVDGQIRPSSVTDWRIIDAMRAVPRDAFVPANQRELAYLDLDLDVSGAGATKRCLLRPVVTARLLQSANLQLAEHVLVVGCATGYLAALAAKLAGRVTATESDGPLAEQARDILQRLGGFGNVEVLKAACLEGAPASGPYFFFNDTATTEIVPTTLYRQLRDGGRLVGIFALGRTPRAEFLTPSDDDFGPRALFDVSAPLLPSLQRSAEFVF
jgi:protein-L-isoaspartate(D-aspartate) O-methyltransferase